MTRHFSLRYTSIKIIPISLNLIARFPNDRKAIYTSARSVHVCHVRYYNDVSRTGWVGGSVTDLALSRSFVTQDYRESSKTLSQRQFQRADVDVCTSCDALTNHRGMHPRLRSTRSCRVDESPTTSIFIEISLRLGFLFSFVKLRLD